MIRASGQPGCKITRQEARYPFAAVVRLVGTLAHRRSSSSVSRKAAQPRRCKRAEVAVRIAQVERESAIASEQGPAVTQPVLEDPWEDSKWTKYKWTVYRGVAYDLTSFMERHPAGKWLLNLSIGRDCTALFESYHLRPDVAVSHLRRLPVLDGFPIDAVPVAPRPNDSELYTVIRERVRAEIFKGAEAKGAHRSGNEWAIFTILGFFGFAASVYTAAPNLLTGFLFGLSGAWIGLTVQHCGNHGAMSTLPLVNNALGLCDDLVGGSSLMWRYHHQVSHHIHCNDDALDEDVFSAFPFLRFDPRLPRKWYHRYQHIYMWFTFPLLQLGFQVSDVQSLLENRTPGATLYGASSFEKATVVLGKICHYSLLLFIPAALHGWDATLPAAAAYVFTQGVVLASTFAVSHNVAEAKPVNEAGTTNPTTDNLNVPYDVRDWGVQQVLTSANWGGVIGNFFTGGLNLQIEHHLFPAISFMHYPAISRIVEEESVKRGINYALYPTLWEILGKFAVYMRDVGAAEQLPRSRGGLTLAEVQSRQQIITRL